MAERPWTWTRQRSKAAQLLADGATELFVAHELGISRNTLTAWRQRPEFTARLAEIAAKVAAALAEKSIANKQARVAALDEGWALMKQLKAERAAYGAAHNERASQQQREWERLAAEIEELRADRDHDHDDEIAALQDRQLALVATRVDYVPGYGTGLLVHRIKVIGVGKSSQTIDEYEEALGLEREMRAHAEQAARELGQWIDQQKTSNDHFLRQYVGLDPDGV